MLSHNVLTKARLRRGTQFEVPSYVVSQNNLI